MKINPEIRRAKAAVEKDLLARKGVTGVGVGEKISGGKRTGTACIRVYVKKKLPKSKLAKADVIPAEINGVPTDVIEREFVLHPAAVALDDLRLQVDAATYDPLTGGISIGPCRAVGGYVYVGTLGLVVEDNDTDDPMMLSNFHVMCIDNGWSAGDTMAQPGRPDGGSCPGGIVGELSRAVLGGQVDGAVARITNRGHNCRITEVGNVSGTATAVDAEPVRKRGRTTELTHGFVDDTSLSVTIDYGDGLGNVTLTNQIGIEADLSQSAQFGNNGDSGSVVVNESEEVIGLYFAGTDDGSYGVANPIGAVLSALDVHLCTPTILPTAAWLDTMPWSDADTRWETVWETGPWWETGGMTANKSFDDVKMPGGYDTLMETIQEGMTWQETGGFTLQEAPGTLQEGIGGFDPGIPIGQPPAGAVPLSLATPHHAREAVRFEQAQRGGGGSEDLDREIERARQYLRALEGRKQGGG
jgi:hypothetical protein